MSTQQGVTPAEQAAPNTKMMDLLNVLLRKLQDRIDLGGQEGRWASKVEAEAFEEVFGS
jgi:hypothetical protein